MKMDDTVLDNIYQETLRLRDAQALVAGNEWHYYNGIVHAIETLQTLDKDIDMSNNNDSLKQYALSIIDDLEEDGADLVGGAYILQWKYDERPDINVTLVLGEFEYIEDDQGDLH